MLFLAWIRAWQIRDGEGTWQRARALIPLADMFNTGPTGTVRHSKLSGNRGALSRGASNGPRAWHGDRGLAPCRGVDQPRGGAE